ncbi:PREDICTED: uncharacterized protein LOC109178468 [Ipomoea nil]|uniref:uncharacterized protein LOC109178468 n=1 Tax=Ipomoea nil TaxID=35883 RepID=UPI000900C6CC|nr:PREDICTED: uncharacterized protein LOC109178468 [Ipomoea nil]
MTTTLATTAMPKFTRLEFPRYDGKDDPIGWMHHCEQFFKAQNTPPQEFVSTTAFHLTGVAQMWHFRLELEEPDMTWQQFKQRCFMRFGPGLRINVLGSLAKLNQDGKPVEEYNNEFQSMLMRSTTVRCDHEVDLYTSGLDEWLRIDVENHRPANLDIAMNLARTNCRRQACAPRETPGVSRRHSNTTHISFAGGSTRPVQSSFIANSRPSVAASSPASIAISSTGSRAASSSASTQPGPNGTAGMTPPPERRLSRAEYIQRCSRGLCYNCDELWSPEHRCKQLFFLVLDDTIEDMDSTFTSDLGTDNPEISLHAITCTNNGQTMQVQMFLADVPVTALIDSGSTHSFVNERTATRLGLRIAECVGLQVAVANGELILGSGMCEKAHITKDGQNFSIRLYLIPLAGFELVLGVNWLRTLGAILWDFTALTMTFTVLGRSITWHGKRVRPHRALRALTTGSPNASALAHVLMDFSDLFQEPTSLPPARSCDHHITLANGVDPVAVRPYRYPQAQKVEIEKQCRSMLALGLIRPSRSPTPHLELNAKTVKDKFPIPVIDELLDELHGSRFFTKLDLRSGYHQIRMHPDDVEETAFRTHHGHFEFLVMPFGLCNAPSTFQALKNEVFGSLLRHIIDANGVSMDSAKIKDVLDWPTPQSTRALRGFLGLAGFYRKFIKDFGLLAAPLTTLLKSHSFNWNTVADGAFAKLKSAVTSAPMLQLLDFNALFIIECDTPGVGIGVVLHQNNHPIAFFSRKLAHRHHQLAAYERELIGLAQAVCHWRHYLWGRKFLIRTDHYSRKILLQQQLTTSPQHHWISKLMGYDFEVEFRAGRLKTVADALSLRDEDSPILFALSSPRSSLLDSISRELHNSPEGRSIISRLEVDTTDTRWSFRDGVLSKWENLCPAGLLQPLPIPSLVWSDISLDFVEGLQKVQGKTALLVVVDRLSKYAHFLPISHPFTAITVANIFFANIVKLHGVPETMVSDRDNTFTCAFWNELFRLNGSTLAFSTAYHPQSDGQTEVTNRTIEMYLRCFVGDKPRQWVEWFPWAEYCYNTSYHTSIRTTLFHVVYGREPPKLLSNEPGVSKPDTVDVHLQKRDAVLTEVRDRLQMAQARMRASYNRTHREVNFELIGKVAYQLELPPDSHIHDVFHVSLLKAFVGEPPQDVPVLPPVKDGKVLLQPADIIRSRLNRGVLEVLVQWEGASPEDSSWESVAHFHELFPSYKLEDKLDLQRGGIDTFVGRTYQRRKKQMAA